MVRSMAEAVGDELGFDVVPASVGRMSVEVAMEGAGRWCPPALQSEAEASEGLARAEEWIGGRLWPTCSP